MIAFSSQGVKNSHFFRYYRFLLPIFGWLVKWISKYQGVIPGSDIRASIPQPQCLSDETPRSCVDQKADTFIFNPVKPIHFSLFWFLLVDSQSFSISLPVDHSVDWLVKSIRLSVEQNVPRVPDRPQRLGEVGRHEEEFGWEILLCRGLLSMRNVMLRHLTN